MWSRSSGSPYQRGLHVSGSMTKPLGVTGLDAAVAGIDAHRRRSQRLAVGVCRGELLTGEANRSSYRSVDAMQPEDLDRLPEPARRYLEHAIAPGTPDATTARLQMRGSIKLGKRWLQFRAHETLTPHEGFVWKARVGADLLRVRLTRRRRRKAPLEVSRGGESRARGRARYLAQRSRPCGGRSHLGSDRARSPASVSSGRQPTTRTPPLEFAVGDVDVQLHLTLDTNGQVVSARFDRWGDPRVEGTFADHPFGMEVTDYATFSGVTIPSAGRVGWDFGTDGWEKGEFFRYRITELTLET